MVKIAVLQMTSGIDPGANFDVIRDAVHAAHAEGAGVLFTPEMSLMVDRDRARAARQIMPQAESPYVGMLANLAAEERFHIALGSMAVALPDGRYANRSMIFSPGDGPPATYDKMHMFDVDLSGGESWRESNAYRAGDKVVVEDISTPTEDGGHEALRVGLSVCYDLRFPALFAALGDRRCDVIAVPAAFTVPTGQAHWHVLLRARAIEASAYVVAAAQVGEHEDGQRTMATAWWSIPGARFCSTWAATGRGWVMPTSILPASPKCARNCQALQIAAKSRARRS